MNARRVRTIFLKELLDTFRDRRTLIAMIGVPVVLYPALFITATQVTIVQQSQMEAQASRVAVSGTDAETVRAWLAAVEAIELREPNEPNQALLNGELDVHARVSDSFDSEVAESGTAGVILEFDAAEARSREGRNRVAEALRDARDRIIAERVSNAGLPETFAHPLEIESENVAPPEKSTGSMLGSILPLVIVVMLGVGAFYPAVDLTAGEKERGTFETLLSTPATKLEIVSGKFLAVWSLSMLTGLLNLASMTATFMFQLSQIAASVEQSMPPIQVPPETLALVFVMLVPLALFISAAMMAVALLARSFREAQNYVSPFFLGIVLPASAAAMPGVKLSAATQFIPIANVSLLLRDLLVGKLAVEMVFFVFLSTAVYALLALLLAAWMFQREDVVLAGGASAGFSFDRRYIEPSTAPTPGLALALFGIVMIAIFYGGTALQAWHLHYGLVLTQVLVILAPVLFVLWYQKVNLRSALNLRAPSLLAAIGSVLVGLGWVVISIQIGVVLNRIFPAPDEFRILSEKLFDLSGLPGGVFTLLLIVAVSPAVCEEALFRGALTSGLRQRMPDWAVVLAVGVLFGLFHLSVYRVVPTALSGIVFTYLVVRTGSIVCSMIAHALLNGLAILVETKNLGPITDRLASVDVANDGVPVLALLGAAFTLVVGIVAIERGRGHGKTAED